MKSCKLYLTAQLLSTLPIRPILHPVSCILHHEPYESRNA